MAHKAAYNRKNYFIKKKFQTGFLVKFFAIIVVEAALALGLFLYMSKGTLTTGYSGYELKVARTTDFFLPSLLTANIVIVIITGIAGIVIMILVSHKIAGPLYRFETVLDIIKHGDLSHRFNLRSSDELMELANGLNSFTETFDKKVSDIKTEIKALREIAEKLENGIREKRLTDEEITRLAIELEKRAGEAASAVDYFKTSHDRRTAEHSSR
ncbi:MAG: methyl-accepting chemotaxis protein [Thermodesulfobacteriota bacterium]